MRRRGGRSWSPARAPQACSATRQTWTGDNATSWETLRWNIRMGLGLALSGVSNAGHDIGGFAGPKPDAELFVRWVEAGRLHAALLDPLLERRRLVQRALDAPGRHAAGARPDQAALPADPLSLRSLPGATRSDFEPIVRPTFAEFPDDPGAYEDCDELMLGPALLVSSVVEPGATTRRVRLPAGARLARLLDRRAPTRAASRSSCPRRSASRRSWCARARRSRSTWPSRASMRAATIARFVVFAPRRRRVRGASATRTTARPRRGATAPSAPGG